MRADRVRGEAGQRHAGREEAGRLQDGRARAAAHRQGPDLRAREGGVEVQHVVDVSAAEGVDRLVRVSEGDQRAAAPGQGPQQPQLRGVRVLVLVHEDRVVGGGQRRRALGEEHRAVQELGVVQRPLHVEDVQVLGEEGGRRLPVGASDAVGEGAEGLRAESQLAGAGEDRPDLVGEAAGGERGPQVVRPADRTDPALALQEGADHHVLLGAGQQPQRVGEQVGVLVGADQAVAEGVEGGGLRGAGTAQPQGGPVAQFHRRLAAEGEDEDPGGVRTRFHAGGDGLDQRGRLPGARSGQDQEWSAGVVNHRPLRCVQHRGIHPFRPGAHEAVRVGGPRTPPFGAVGGRGDHVRCRSWWVCGVWRTGVRTVARSPAPAPHGRSCQV